MNILSVESDDPLISIPSPSLIACFLCRSNSIDIEHEQQQDIREKYYFTGSNGNSTLNRQLWNVFLVKKLLSVSESVCEGILIRETINNDSNYQNDDGNLWFSVCQNCSPSLEEGWTIYEQIVRLEGKLRELGRRLRGQIKASGGDDGMEEMAAVEKRIWECLLNKTDSLVVKQEVDHFEDDGEVLNDFDTISSINDDGLFVKKEDDLDNFSLPPSPLKLSKNQKSKRSRRSLEKAKSSLRSHSKSKNPNMKCSRCGQIFRQFSELNSHLQLHSKSDQNGNRFDCPLCKYPCFSETNLRQHKSRKHKTSTNYPCDICGYLAPGKKRLARHRKLHENLVAPKTYQCDLCPKDNQSNSQFLSYLSFTRHQRLNHAQELGITLYKCLQCPSVYTTNKMLQDHVLHVHQKNSRWCCEICGKGLLSESNLKEHLTTHEPKTRTEICYVCGVDFLNERTLREHVRKFHPDYTRHRGTGKDKTKVLEEDKCYKCLYCTFTSPFRLVVMRHRKEHKEIFRHNCDICGNGYSTQSSLKLHKKISHGDGGHVVKCDWCGKSFAHKHYLQNHQPRCKMRPVGVSLERNRKPFKDTLLVTPEDGEKVIVKRVNVPRKKKDVKLEEGSSGPKLMTCKYCSTFKTDNRGKMYGHVMQQHRDALEFKYSCHLCGMRYTSKPSLTRHMVIVHPSDDRAVVNCQFCEKQFRHWSLLRVHYKFWCKAMPEGMPIPEPPNKKGEGESGEVKILSTEKGVQLKELKFRVERKRKTRQKVEQGSHSGNLEGGLEHTSQQGPSTSSFGEGVVLGRAAQQMNSVFINNPPTQVVVEKQQQRPWW